MSNIREVDAIVHVVRCFEDSNVVHVDGSVNPLRDIETINLELIFSDLEILERRIAKVAKGARMDKEQAKELAMLERVKERLEDGKLAIGFETEDEDEEEYFKNLNLLTAKQMCIRDRFCTVQPCRDCGVPEASGKRRRQRHNPS